MLKEEKIKLLCGKVNNVNKILAAHGIGREDRDDLLQEVFVEALRTIGKLKDVRSIDSWLWKVTEGCVREYVTEATEKRHAEMYIDEAEKEKVIVETKNIIDLDQMADSMEQLVNREDVQSALRKIDRDTLTIMNLRYGLEYSLGEIAVAQKKEYQVIQLGHLNGLEQIRQIIRDEKKAEVEKLLEEFGLWRY